MRYLGLPLLIILLAGSVVVPALVAFGLRRHAGPLVIFAALANTALTVSTLTNVDRGDDPGLFLFSLGLVGFEAALVVGAAIAAVRRLARWTRLIAVVLAATCLPVLYLALISGSN